MKLCPACDRHLFGPEPTCPFCGAAQASTAARQPASALASLTLALTLGTVSCGPIVDPQESNDSSSSVDDATTGPPISTSTTAMTTVPPTGDGPSMTTDDGPMTTIEPSTSSTDDRGDDPCAFYAGCPPDVDSPIECDPFVQDCPVGEKCMPWADDGAGVWNATRCSPVDPDPNAPGEPCTVEGSGTSGLDSCDVGVMCFDVDPETNEGTCVAMCTGSPADPLCAEPEEACLIANDGVLVLCLDTCNPLEPACEPGTECYPSPTSDAFLCLPDSGEGEYGAPCEFTSACAPGHACLDGSVFPACAEASCCTPFCDITAGLPCPDDALGVTCQPWYEDGMAPPGYENVGACTLPP